MCGIAGLATADGLRRDDQALVDGMLETLRHRGPDDHHTVADGQAVIGSRRLAIIDLDTGRQPLANEDGTIQVSQNGEIYNYVELRAELEAAGHRFATHGDTEVIVHLYEDLGDRFVERLRGMFAIAIWDQRRRRLVLARDRLGKKPLYWRLADGRLAYASELKALLRDPAVARTVDRTALAQYLQYLYVPSPRSIIAGIQKLPPASLLVWEGGEAPRVSRYWTPTYDRKVVRTPAEDREALLDLLRESVRIRLRSDVPVGVFLSGGVDSSTVVALMAEASSAPVQTFTIGFDEQRYDELPYARAVARHFGTDHAEEVVRLDALELLPSLAVTYDEPFADSSALPTYRVAQLAGARLKVVLTGDGGDETFGGYDRYRFQMAMDLSARLPGLLRRAIAAGGQGVFRTAGRHKLRRRAASWSQLSALDRDSRYVGLMSTFTADERARLLGDGSGAQDGFLRDLLAGGPDATVDRLLRADTLSYLPEDLLVKMDRATMASSLEARAPLLDHRLVEFAAALPVDRKMGLRKGKLLLREVARTLLPEGVLDRPKRGFGVPVDTWFKGALGDHFRETVLAPDSRIRDHLDPALGATLLEDHRTTGNHADRLWTLLMFELWCRTWLGASVPEPAGR